MTPEQEQGWRDCVAEIAEWRDLLAEQMDRQIPGPELATTQYVLSVLVRHLNTFVRERQPTEVDALRAALAAGEITPERAALRVQRAAERAAPTEDRREPEMTEAEGILRDAAEYEGLQRKLWGNRGA